MIDTRFAEVHTYQDGLLAIHRIDGSHVDRDVCLADADRVGDDREYTFLLALYYVLDIRSDRSERFRNRRLR